MTPRATPARTGRSCGPRSERFSLPATRRPYHLGWVRRSGGAGAPSSPAIAPRRVTARRRGARVAVPIVSSWRQARGHGAQTVTARVQLLGSGRGRVGEGEGGQQLLSAGIGQRSPVSLAR